MNVAINKIVDQYFPKKPTLLQQFLESVRSNYDISKLKGTYDAYGRLIDWHDDEDYDDDDEFVDEQNDQSYPIVDNNNIIHSDSSSTALIPTTARNLIAENDKIPISPSPNHHGLLDFYKSVNLHNNHYHYHHQPHKSYPLAFKLEVISVAKIHGNRQAARNYAVGECLIRDWAQKEEELLEMMNSPQGSQRFRLRGGGRKKKFCPWIDAVDSKTPPVSMVSVEQRSYNDSSDLRCQDEPACSSSYGLSVAAKRNDQDGGELATATAVSNENQNSSHSSEYASMPSLNPLTNGYGLGDEIICNKLITSPIESEYDYSFKESDIDFQSNSTANFKNETKFGLPSVVSSAPDFLRNLGLALVMSEYGKPNFAENESFSHRHVPYVDEQHDTPTSSRYLSFNNRKSCGQEKLFKNICKGYFDNIEYSPSFSTKNVSTSYQNIDDSSSHSLASSTSAVSNEEFHETALSMEKSSAGDSGKKPTLLKSFLQYVVANYKKLKGVYDDQGQLLEWHDDETDEYDTTGKCHEEDESSSKVTNCEFSISGSTKNKFPQQSVDLGKNDLGFMLEVVDFAKKWSAKNASRYFGIEETRIQDWTLRESVLLELLSGKLTAKRELADKDDDVVEVIDKETSSRGDHVFLERFHSDSGKVNFSSRKPVGGCSNVKNVQHATSSSMTPLSTFDCTLPDKNDDDCQVRLGVDIRRKLDLSFKLEVLQYAKVYGNVGATRRYRIDNGTIEEWLREEADLVSTDYVSNVPSLRQDSSYHCDVMDHSAADDNDAGIGSVNSNSSLPPFSNGIPYTGDSVGDNNALSDDSDLHKPDHSAADCADPSPSSELTRLRQRLYPGPVTYQQKRKFNVDFKLMAIGFAKQYGNAAACRSFDLDRKQIRGWRKQESLFLEAKMSSNDSLTCFRLRGGGRKPSSSKDYNFAQDMVYPSDVQFEHENSSYYSAIVKTEVDDSEDSSTGNAGGENFEFQSATIKTDQDADEEELL